jgi:protein SCO1/2
MYYRARMLSAVLAISAVSLVCGCRQQKSKNQVATASAAKAYSLRGKVVSVDTAAGVVIVDHEAIPRFMDAMTMPYKLKDMTVAAKLHPGDRITAKVLVGQDEDDALLDEVVVTAQPNPANNSIVR